MLSETFLSIALIGIDPVLWLLVFMSVVSVAVMIERCFVFHTVGKEYASMDIFAVRLILEERLGILATFGNNAPFIGLFGTVLGVIQAFHAIGKSNAFDVQWIMQGISEALIATAAGLFVAIPCVMAYNYFIRKLNTILTLKEAQVHGL